jgi:hypothetical protein
VQAPLPYGLLIAGFDYANIAEDEFNAWYDTEHIPERMAVKGFINAQRWIGADNPQFALATYDLESVRVLDDPGYKIRKAEGRTPWSRRIASKTKLLVRIVGEQLLPGRRVGPDDAGGLLMVAFNVKPEADADFQAWSDQEHLPSLAKVAGVLSARRFKATEGEPKYIAVYHLTHPEVQASAAWQAAIDTPWSARIRPQMRDRIRYVLRRYQPKTQQSAL